MTIQDLVAELTEITADLGEVTIPVDLREPIEAWLDSERLRRHAANPIAVKESS